MFVRTGFVSNSSSSTFHGLGKFYEDNTLLELVKKNLPDCLVDWSGNKVTNENLDRVDLVKSLKSLKLTVIEQDWGTGTFVGNSPELMKNEDTLSNFKRKIAGKIKNFDPKVKWNDMKFQTITTQN